jgi:hypothetical protein
MGGMDDIFDSKVGKVLVILYALGALGTYAYVFWCGVQMCDVYVVLPTMPWTYIFASDFGITLPWATYPIFMVLNTSVAYVVGAGVEWLYRRFRGRAQH